MDLPISPEQKLEYLYREYVRLNEKAEDYIKESFNDFKLFGAVGAVAVLWKPISDAIVASFPAFSPDVILFFGFVCFYVVFGLICSLALLRHAYGWYFIYNLRAYELRIKQMLQEPDGSQIFNFNLGKEEPRFITPVYRISFRLMIVAFSFSTTVLPFLIIFQSSIRLALLYLAMAVVGAFTYLLCFKRMMRQYSTQNYFGL